MFVGLSIVIFFINRGGEYWTFGYFGGLLCVGDVIRGNRDVGYCPGILSMGYCPGNIVSRDIVREYCPVICWSGYCPRNIVRVILSEGISSGGRLSKEYCSGFLPFEYLVRGFCPGIGTVQRVLSREYCPDGYCPKNIVCGDIVWRILSAGILSEEYCSGDIVPGILSGWILFEEYCSEDIVRGICPDTLPLHTIDKNRQWEPLSASVATKGAWGPDL